MNIRKATLADLNQLVKIESICFPESEAASRENIKKRLITFSNCFWVLEEKGKIIAFINGMLTDEKTICDEMFEDTSFYDPDGAWLAIFGVDTLPAYQGKGYASMLMNSVIKEMSDTNCKGCILTCKDSLIKFYEKLGYVNIGISKSVHGGAKWYDMILKLNNEYNV